MFGLSLRRLALLLFVVLLSHVAAVASRPLEGRQLLGDDKEEKKDDKHKSEDSFSNKLNTPTYLRTLSQGAQALNTQLTTCGKLQEKSLNARIGKYESKKVSGSKEDKKEYDNKISDMNKRLKALKSKQENRHSKLSKSDKKE